MSTFQRVKQELIENKKVREQGGYTCIPFVLLPELGNVIPGIQKKKYSLCTASSKVGKSKLAQFLFVYNPYTFVTTHKTDITLKVIYNSLEVSKEEIIAQYLSYRLYVDHKIIIAPDKLRSNFQNYILSNSLMELINTYDDEMARFESMVLINDVSKNPFGIYNRVRQYAYDNGVHLDKKGVKIDKADLLSNNTEVRDKAIFSIDSYKPNNPNEYVIIITDHLSLLHSEKGGGLWDTMGYFSSKYCLHMRDRWSYHIVNVQQQASDQEKQQFTFKGDSVIAKLRPTTDGLADNKTTQRDVDLMFGLFAPHRYKIPRYEGYDIDKLGDNYREFMVMLNRSGTGFINSDLYFNGACNYFKTLPSADKMTEENYRNIKKLNNDSK
jgi:hypothetical protein